MTIDSTDDSKISNRTITTNRISNRTYDSKSNHEASQVPSIYTQNDLYCVGWGVKLYSLTPYTVGECRKISKHVPTLSSASVCSGPLGYIQWLVTVRRPYYILSFRCHFFRHISQDEKGRNSLGRIRDTFCTSCDQISHRCDLHVTTKWIF